MKRGGPQDLSPLASFKSKQSMLRLVVFSCILASSGGLYTVTTLCGNTSVGSGDGSCSSTTFSTPSGICVGSNSTFALVADYDGSCLRHINLRTKIVTTIAGSAATGYADGYGSTAAFVKPYGVAIDAASTFALITDAIALTIRRLNLSSGVVTTLAGTGGSYGYGDGKGSLATFAGPKGIALDAIGSVAVVCDAGNHVLRRVNVSTAYVSMLAGLPAFTGYTDGMGSVARFRSPEGLAMDAAGSFVIVADNKNGIVRRINMSTGAVTTLAGNASAAGSSTTGSTFYKPTGVTLDLLNQAALIVDHGSARIRRVNLVSGLVDTISGQAIGYADGVDSAVQFSFPTGCALDSTGTLFVTDTGNNVIRVVSSTTPLPSFSPSVAPTPVIGLVSTVAGVSMLAALQDGCGRAARFAQPYDVAHHPRLPAIIVADWGNRAIRYVNMTSGCVTTLAESSSNPGNADGVGTFASLSRPYGIAFDSSGAFAVFTDSGGNLVRKIAVSVGLVTTLAGSTFMGYVDGASSAAFFDGPAGLALDAVKSVVLVADQGNHAIRRLDLSRGIVTTLSGNGSFGADDGLMSAATFNSPTGVAIDSTGDVALVADARNSCIRRLNLSSGLVSTVAGLAGRSSLSDGVGSLAGFYAPGGITVACGIAFITDIAGAVVRRLDFTSGSVTTIAGGTRGFVHADGVGSQAAFEGPSGISINAAGTEVVVVDHTGSTIRSIVVSVASASASATQSMRVVSSPSPSASFIPHVESTLQDRVLVSTLAGNVLVPGYSDGAALFAEFDQPSSGAMGPNASYVLVTDPRNACLRRITLPSAVVSTFAGSHQAGSLDGVSSLASFTSPQGIASNAAGTSAYVADLNGVIRQVNITSGRVTTIAGAPGLFGKSNGQGTGARFLQPLGIAVDAEGIVAVITDRTILRLLDVISGTVSALAGAWPTYGYADGTGTSASFSTLTGVSMDSSGTFVIVSDSTNNLLRKVVISSASVSTLAGGEGTTVQGSADGWGREATFMTPNGVAIDAAAARAVVADTGNCRMRIVNITSGMVTTLAGSTCGYADGEGMSVLFSSPYGVVMLPSGSAMIVTDGNALRYIQIEQPSASPVPKFVRNDTSHSGSQSLSGSPSTSATSSTSPSPSQSVSPYPFSLSLLPLNSATHGPVTVSDSLAPIALHLWLSRCPSLSDAALFATSSVLCAGTSIFAALSSTTAMDDAAATIAANLASPCAAGDTPVRLYAIARAGVPFRSTATRSSLVCRVTSATNLTLGAASIQLAIKPTLWPLWDDAIVVSANGVMRSTRLGIRINATSELRLAGACVGDITNPCGMGLPMRVLSVGQALWGNTSISVIDSSLSDSLPFSLTVSGSSRIMLRALWPAFSRNASSNASLGGVACNVSALSDDGAWVLIDTPSSTVLCGSATRDCGYVSLSLSNAPTSTAFGATLSCPPFCAGALDEDSIPLATGSGTFSLGSSPRTSVGSLPSYVAPLSMFTSAGVYYSASCSQTGLWPDTTSSVCQNASDPASAACPFGGGDGCTLCPSNAVCRRIP